MLVTGGSDFVVLASLGGLTISGFCSACQHENQKDFFQGSVSSMIPYEVWVR